MNRIISAGDRVKTFTVLFLTLVSIGGWIGCHAVVPSGMTPQSRWKVAILPFENLSNEEGAGRIAGNIFLVKALNSGVFDIADPGAVDEELGAERVRLTAHIPLETLRKIGKRLQVHYILMGSVLEDEMQILSGVGGGGQVPSVALTTRMIDVRTGRVVWADAQSKRGTDYEKIFGFGRIYSTSRLMEIVTEKMVSSLTRSLAKQGLEPGDGKAGK